MAKHQCIQKHRSRDVRNVEVQLHKTTGQMVQCSIPNLKVMDHINVCKTLNKGVLKPLVVDAFKMMAHSVAFNSKRRWERIKNAVLPKFCNMIQKSKPSATLLLGDKIKEKVKSLNEKSTAVTLSAGSSKQAFYRNKEVQPNTTDKGTALTKTAMENQENASQTTTTRNCKGKRNFRNKSRCKHNKTQQGKKKFRK